MNFQKFGVRVWEYYRTSRSLGYGYGSVTELTEVWGTGMRVLQNLQKSGVRVWEYYRTSRSLGYGYGSITELPEVWGTGMGVLQNSRKFRVLWHGRAERADVPGGYKKSAVAVPVPRVLWRGAYITQGTGINFLQNMQKFRVLVLKSYRTSRRSYLYTIVVVSRL